MRRTSIAWATAAMMVYAAGATGAHAAGAPLRIGMLAPYSGPYALYGQEFHDGAALYLKQHGGMIAGRPVTMIEKDTTGPDPALAKRLADELVVQDHASLLTGLAFSPNAFAVAKVASQARIPTVVMNAAASGITLASPYVVRVSFTEAQVTEPMAKWVYRHGSHTAYTLVADYAPGLDAQKAFEQFFGVAGGKLVGGVRTPMNTLDFSPYVQRIKQVHPQAVFFFLPSGPMCQAFLRAWQQAGMEHSGIKLYATGDATDDAFLQATGKVALGLITSYQYSYAHPSELNRSFVQDFEKTFGDKLRPNAFAVAAYDGMHAIDLALTSTGGKVDGPAVMKALEGLKFDSPRGPITIDPATRDIEQTVYIRKVEMQDGKLVNHEFDQVDNVLDPYEQNQH